MIQYKYQQINKTIKNINKYRHKSNRFTAKISAKGKKKLEIAKHFT